MKTNSSNILKELSGLPEKCIYGLFNDQDKKVYIGYSSNIVRTLYNNMSLKYSNIDFDKLEFRVIEPIEDSNRLRIRYQYWVARYSNEGWGMYRNYKAVQYKVRIDFMADVNLSAKAKVLLYVKLISRGYKELIVGVFDNLEECNGFVGLHYSNIHDIVYADNELTKKYRKFVK